MTQAARLLAALLAMLALPAPSLAQRLPVGPFPSGMRYDPRLDFQTLRAGRFDIHYHGEVEPLARRLAGLVEPVAREIDARLGAPRGRVHVILVDQTDQSNGWATVVPYNLIELAAVPPPANSEIGNTDDWLRLVFAHEYAHVAHLEKSRGWLGALRHVFGRLPLFYSNLALPLWQIEGLATLEESTVTGRGRVPAGDFRMLLGEAASAGRFEPLDRASQPITAWPGGAVPYLYGAYFHEYLADRYGRESVDQLAEATARRLPYLGARAFREVYGRSLGELWQDFEAHVARASGPPQDAPRERLTAHGYRVSAPALAGSRLFYSVSNPDGFPAIVEWREGRPPRRVATRFGGEQLSVAGNQLVFDQLEFVRNAGLQSDLYAVPLDGGASRRLTRGARAADPDVSPDGSRLALTVQESDRRALAVMRLPAAGETGEPTLVVSEPGVRFARPRWAPDGLRVVAERRAPGGPWEIVIVDMESGAVETVVSSRAARNVTPAWTPDGSAVLFASDRDGGPFTLFEVALATGQVARVAGAGSGAQSPALRPDGSSMVFVGYTADGYDLFGIPAGVPRVPVSLTESAASPTPAPTSMDQGEALGAYGPWATLTPRFWTPLIEGDPADLTIGGATGGYDALGRHAWFATAGWSIEHARPGWDLEYAYTRWRPQIFAAASDRVESWRRGRVTSLEADVGVVVPVRRVRWQAAGLVSLHASRDVFDCAPCGPPVDVAITRRSLRAGWTASNARQFSRSISPEQGAAVSMTAEWTRRALGADADAGALVVEAQAYQRVTGRRDVLAVRLASATTWGDAPSRRVYSASGGGAQGIGFGMGRDAIGLLRGLGPGELAGSHAAVGNLDYRFPLVRIERGLGTAPVMLRAIHAALFADAGTAWDDGAARRIQRAFGGELSADAVFGYAWPLTVSAGVAWREGPAATGWATFVRLGRAF